jgi:NTP pyrophosphatase (non-canonical NTP hydrolase)
MDSYAIPVWSGGFCQTCLAEPECEWEVCENHPTCGKNAWNGRSGHFCCRKCHSTEGEEHDPECGPPASAKIVVSPRKNGDTEALTGWEPKRNKLCCSNGRLTVSEFVSHVKESRLQCYPFDYFMLGIVEETGEVFGVVRSCRAEAKRMQAETDASFSECFDAVKGNTVLCELGDVLWYCVAFSLEFDELAMPASWPERPVPSTVECLHSILDADDERDAILMMECVAKLSGRVKKRLRGDKPPEDFLPDMKKMRDELLNLCAAVAATYGATLQQCALLNVEKLHARFEAGSVRGEGNER